MPLATLKTVLELADARNAACLGFVCQGWEDARAYTCLLYTSDAADE